MLNFLLKPKLKKVGGRYIESIVTGDHFYEIKFKSLASKLYWPKAYSELGIYQVSAETFDATDWHNYQNVFKVLSSDTVLDIGAAEGLFALSVVDKCKKIILVEPNSKFVMALEKTFFPHKDVVDIIEVAVGDKSGSSMISDDSLSGSIMAASGLGKTVEIDTIDHLIGERKIDFLKADIEGYEFKMLKGAVQTISRNKPKIVITTYHDENNADEIVDLIRSMVPEYNFKKRGVFHKGGKPVTVHFWIDEKE